MDSCILCNKKNKPFIAAKNFIFDEEAEVAFCKDCKLYYLNKSPSKEFLDKYYSSEYFNELKQNKAMYLLKSFFSRMRSFSQYKYITRYKNNPASILEIGSSDGTFLSIFKKRGWKVRGLEYNDHMVRKAKQKYRINLEKKSILDIDPKENSFDVIALPHVLEHMLDPIDVLKHCNELLKPDGIIFIELPHSPSRDEVSKEELKEYFESTHIFNFIPESLSKLIHRSDLDVISIKRFFYNIPNIMQHSSKLVGRALMKAEAPFLNPIKAGTILSSVSNMTIHFLLNHDPMKQLSLSAKWKGLGDNIRIIAEKKK